MKKYNNFILENNYITSISQEKSMEILKSLPYYDNLINGNTTLIYRKVKRKINHNKNINDYNNNYLDFNIVDPKNIERISPYAESNLYNLLFSNLENWSKYPKRNKSLICGDFADVEYRAGDKLMLVFPLEPKLAVCPVDDIWDSFYPSITCNLSDFFQELYNITNFDDINYDNLLIQLKNFDEARSSTNSDVTFKRYIKNKDLCDRWSRKEISTVELLNIIFDPDKNNFEIINYDGLNIPYNREVWTDSKCLLIEPRKYKNGIIYK